MAACRGTANGFKIDFSHSFIVTDQAPHLPEFLTIEDGIACYRPVGDYSLDAAATLINDALAYCRENEIRRLFVDTHSMRGFSNPSTVDRYMFIEKWAATAAGRVILSMASPADRVDPDKIGVTMARNRGLQSNSFVDPKEAIAWLKGTSTA